MQIKSNEPNSISRIQSVDSSRLIAIFFIIILHTAPFRNVHLKHEELFSLGVIVNVVARFAVPFFFVISGYFWGIKVLNGSPVWPMSLQMIRRIGISYAVFCLLYLMPTQLVSIYKHGLSGPIDSRRNIELEILNQPAINWPFVGTEEHLWFLPALICAILISAIFVRLKMPRFLLFVALGLYLFGLFAKSYSATPLGFSFSFNTRNGPFFGLIFFVLGYVLSRYPPKSTWFVNGCAVMALGYLIQFSELNFLAAKYLVSPIQDCVVGTLFLGVGAALISLSDMPILRNRFMAYIGRFSLGIYALHYVFAENFWVLRSISPMIDVLVVISVFILSIGATLLLARNKILARFLT